MKRIAHIVGHTIVNVSLAEDDAPLAPDTMLESDALAAGYLYQSITDVKKWPSVAEFWAEFTTDEALSIALSSDSIVALLRTNLAMWRGAVHADDPQITEGLAYLVSIDLITADRISAIIG
jgi:hypothetical protein